jgi:hypothetical protein
MIDTLDKLVNALGNNSSRVVIDKASISNAVAGAYQSLWRATGQPGQGAIPTAAALCDKNLVGSIQWPNQTLPNRTYYAFGYAVCSNAAVTIEIHDRLAHIGGLVLNVTTLQNSVLSPSDLSVSAERIGDVNFSDIQWWLEVYTDGGATASNATINVTYNDDTTGNLTVVAVGGTLRASRMLPLNGLIPAAQSGKYIKAINSVQLSASTGTAGNFGFTATRPRITKPLNVANKTEVFDWTQLGFPEVFNDSCLFSIEIASTTTTGTVRGGGKLSHG